MFGCVEVHGFSIKRMSKCYNYKIESIKYRPRTKSR